MWFELLKKDIEVKGVSAVAKKLGLSKATISLVCNDKYPADKKKIEERIRKTYGGTKIRCPVLEVITLAQCLETRHRAKLIGMKAGNPETLRLYKACHTCKKREA